MTKAMTRRRLIKLTAAFAASSAVPHNVQAQAYPNRIIRLIAPFPAGGGTDSAARIIAAGLSELLGQQVVVDNRPGAGSNIGAEAAARAAPDGYTLLLGAPTLAINRFLYASLNYDSVADLAPVSLLCRFPNILAVPVSSPLTSVRSFIDYARANPGKLTYSSPGIGTTPHLSGELFKRMAGIELVHVPYRGAGAGAITDTIAGRVDSAINTTGSLLQTVRSGQLRGLAVTTLKRFPTAPELPTIAESGVPGFDVSRSRPGSSHSASLSKARHPKGSQRCFGPKSTSGARSSRPRGSAQAIEQEKHHGIKTIGRLRLWRHPLRVQR